jgi:hypothetical protein
MTPNERLKDIEEQFQVEEIGGNNTEWLINRVKKLTSALELIVSTTGDDKFVAWKALEDE